MRETNENGESLFFDYFFPDVRMPRVIVEYCERVVEATGVSIFVIDREVNSVRIAQEFHNKGWKLLSMLDNNEYKGLSDWSAEMIAKLKDGSLVYWGEWARPRENDTRKFVIVKKKDRLLPYWGTPQHSPKPSSRRNGLRFIPSGRRSRRAALKG